MLYLYGLNQYSTFNITTAAIVEIVIRTIKNKLYKLFGLRGKYIWFDKLQDVINKYNHNKHANIRIRSIDVSSKNEMRLFNAV